MILKLKPDSLLCIEFVNMLNEMRFGRLSQKSIAKFKSLSRNVVYEDGLGPTELYILFRALTVTLVLTN